MAKITLPRTVDELRQFHGPAGHRIVGRCAGYLAGLNCIRIHQLADGGSALFSASDKFKKYIEYCGFGSIFGLASELEVCPECDDDLTLGLLQELEPESGILVGSLSIPESSFMTVQKFIESRKYSYVEIFCIYPQYGGWMFWRARDFEFFGSHLLSLPKVVIDSTVCDVSNVRYRYPHLDEGSEDRQKEGF